MFPLFFRSGWYNIRHVGLAANGIIYGMSRRAANHHSSKSGILYGITADFCLDFVPYNIRTYGKFLENHMQFSWKICILYGINYIYNNIYNVYYTENIQK